MSRVAAGIVTYNPEMKKFKQNILSIISQVDELIIFDNGSRNISEIQKLLNPMSNIELIKSKDNIGIAAGLNRVFEYCVKNKIDYVYTLDQDSISPDCVISELLSLMNEKTAVVAPDLVYVNDEASTNTSTKPFEEVEWVITSGSLTNVKAWEKINGFDEFMFIDAVDTEFCIRAKMAGFNIIRDNRVTLYHELGSLRIRRLFGKKIFVTNHNPVRLFYQTRNSIYMNKKLGYGKPVFSIFKYLTKVILFESEKKDKLIAINSGIRDGIKTEVSSPLKIKQKEI